MFFAAKTHFSTCFFFAVILCLFWTSCANKGDEPEESVPKRILSIVGRLTDSFLFQGIQGVEVSVQEYKVYSDESGFYSLKDIALPYGSNTVTLSKQGYVSRMIVVKVTDDTYVVSEDIYMDRALGTLFARVEDVNHQGISNAKLWVLKDAYLHYYVVLGTGDAEGNILVEKAPFGSLDIIVAAKGYSSMRDVLEVHQNEYSVTFTMVDNHIEFLSGSYRISFTTEPSERGDISVTVYSDIKVSLENKAGIKGVTVGNYYLKVLQGSEEGFYPTYELVSNPENPKLFELPEYKTYGWIGRSYSDEIYVLVEDNLGSKAFGRLLETGFDKTMTESEIEEYQAKLRLFDAQYFTWQ